MDSETLKQILQAQEASNKWQVNHEAFDAERFAQIPTKEDMEDVVHKVMKEYLVAGGGRLKTGVIATAVIMGSIGVIITGFKVFVVWAASLIGR